LLTPFVDIHLACTNVAMMGRNGVCYIFICIKRRKSEPTKNSEPVLLRYQ